MKFFALLINPRDGELAQAGQVPEFDRNTIGIFDLRGAPLGQGYFHGRTRSAATECEETTQYPRVHTAEGVVKKGSGLGTVLYTALAAATAYNDEPEGDWLGLEVNEVGAGVTSGDRSADASRWWDAAVTKYGLAVRKDLGGGRFCDAYPYGRAFRNHLVVAMDQSGTPLPSVLHASAKGLRVVDPVALAAANLGALRPGATEEVALFVKNLLEAGKRAGLSEADFKLLKRTMAGGYDVQKTKKTRKNPATKTSVEPKFYGARQNPVDMAQAQKDAETLARKRRCWDKFKNAL